MFFKCGSYALQIYSRYGQIRGTNIEEFVVQSKVEGKLSKEAKSILALLTKVGQLSNNINSLRNKVVGRAAQNAAYTWPCM